MGQLLGEAEAGGHEGVDHHLSAGHEWSPRELQTPKRNPKWLKVGTKTPKAKTFNYSSPAERLEYLYPFFVGSLL